MTALAHHIGSATMFMYADYFVKQTNRWGSGYLASMELGTVIMLLSAEVTYLIDIKTQSGLNKIKIIKVTTSILAIIIRVIIPCLCWYKFCTISKTARSNNLNTSIFNTYYIH